MLHEIPNSELLDKVIDRITDYSELDAPNLQEGQQKFSEHITTEDVKENLVKLEKCFRVMRTHLQRPDGTYFDQRHGFPTEQGPNKDLEAYNNLTVEQVIKGYKSWIETEGEKSGQIYPEDKENILYALGPGYDFFKGYYGLKDSDPWKKADNEINSKQSYKRDGYPSPRDIQDTLYFIQHEHS